MTTATISNVLEAIKTLNLEVETQKIQIAWEGHHAAENEKTISGIAKEYEVSRRTVNRYMEKYEEQVEDVNVLLAEQAKPEPKAAKKEKQSKVELTETYAKIIEVEVKSRSGRVRTRPSKRSVSVFEAVNGEKEKFFEEMYKEGKSKSFVEREFRRARMYMDEI